MKSDKKVSDLDAEALRRGIEDGRSDRHGNPYEGDSGPTKAAKILIAGPFAGCIIDPGDPDKSNAYEIGHALGANDKK